MKVGRITFGPEIEAKKLPTITYRQDPKNDSVRKEREKIMGIILQSKELGLSAEEILALIIERLKDFQDEE